MRYTDAGVIQEILGTLTLKQLWCLTKITKHVRLRCRNNTAFNNYMNGIFPYAKFATVTKQKQDGTLYPGLQITVAGATEEEDDDFSD